MQVPPAPLLLLDTVLTEQSCGYSQNPSNQARAVSSPLLSRPGVTMFCTEMPAENSELGQASWVQRVQGAGLRGDPLARSHACPVRILRRGRPCAALRLTRGEAPASRGLRSHRGRPAACAQTLQQGQAACGVGTARDGCGRGSAPLGSQDTREGWTSQRVRVGGALGPPLSREQGRCPAGAGWVSRAAGPWWGAGRRGEDILHGLEGA